MIILNYRESSLSIKLCNKIQHYSNINKILIVDNGSDNDSLQLLMYHCQFMPKVELLALHKNDGYATGNQLGLNYLLVNNIYDIIVFSNPDVYFDEIFIDAIISKFKLHTDYLLLTGLMIDSDNTGHSKFAYWRETTYIDDLLSMFYLGRKMLKKYLKYNHKIDDLLDVDVVPGSLFAVDINRLKFDLFDTSTFLYYEEDILSKRIKAQNYRIGVITSSRYSHFHQPKRKTVKLYSIYLRSMLYYQKEYNNISIIQYGLLKIASYYSIFELGMMNILSKIIRCISPKPKNQDL